MRSEVLICRCRPAVRDRRERGFPSGSATAVLNWAWNGSVVNRSAPCLGQSVVRMRERGHGSGRAACKRVPGAGRVSSSTSLWIGESSPIQPLSGPRVRPIGLKRRGHACTRRLGWESPTREVRQPTRPPFRLPLDGLLASWNSCRSCDEANNRNFSKGPFLRRPAAMRQCLATRPCRSPEKRSSLGKRYRSPRCLGILGVPMKTGTPIFLCQLAIVNLQLSIVNLTSKSQIDN